MPDLDLYTDLIQTGFKPYKPHTHTHFMFGSQHDYSPTRRFLLLLPFPLQPRGRPRFFCVAAPAESV